MLIESLAQKTKLALMTVLATIGGCTLICGFTVWCCISLVTKEREQIYILDGDIPFLAQRARLEANFTMEAKAHIQLFHQYFFNLPPDAGHDRWLHPHLRVHRLVLHLARDERTRADLHTGR